MKDLTFIASGYYLIFDEDNRIVSPGPFHPEAEGMTLEEAGFSEFYLDVKEKKPFFIRLLGEWSHCMLCRTIRHYKIYAVIPLKDIYGTMIMNIFISGFCLFFLCLLFRWTILRMIRVQKEVDNLHKQKEQMRQKDLELARMVQMSELKEDNPDTPNYSIRAGSIPAREVGGDFYDYYDLPDGRTVVIIADASGKGMPAAIFMMKAKTTIKLYSFRTASIEECFQKTNDSLCKHNDALMFVTIWGGVYDPKTGTLEFISAGHNPPLILHADGNVEWIKGKTTLPLGVRPGRTFHSETVSFSHGDRLFLYTDGVTEAMNKAGEQYGCDRLVQVLKRAGTKRLHRVVFDDVKKFSHGAEQADDITILAMKTN